MTILRTAENSLVGILFVLVTTSLVCLGAALAPVANCQRAVEAAAGSKNSAPPLLQRMVGDWTVQQRMWPGATDKAIDLPPAVARRRLVRGEFLEEIMESTQGLEEGAFTRIAYFNYNAVNQQYEYFSIDTRAPQMMNERSFEVGSRKEGDEGMLSLQGGSFVATQWGASKNAAFRYRLLVAPVKEDRPVVQLYLTPQSGEGGPEFLAFEYVYTRQK